MNILFDLDGTLTDPGRGITGCLRHALARLGRPAPPTEALRRFVGPPLRETFAELLQCSDPEAIEHAVVLYRERFVGVGMFENEVYPGVPAGLQALKGDGHRLWVVTSKPTVYADRIVQHFGLSAWLEGVYGSEFSGTNGDKRGLIRDVLDREHLGRRATWMVGDRMHDIRGARANGVSCVGVRWGYGAEDELREAQPDHVVASMSELCQLMREEGR